MSKTINYKVQIDASPQKVWDVIADFGGVYKYSPGVNNSELLSEHGQGVGADRICYLAPAGQIQERILSWDEGRSYSLEIYTGKGAPPFKKAIATLSLAETATGTEVTADFEYEVKYGLVGMAMDKMMVGRFLDKGFQGLLSGLKHHIETGEEVTGPQGLQFVAVPA